MTAYGVRGLSVFLLSLGTCGMVEAQRPQDNWYQDAVWVKTNAVAQGGLVEPYGVAIARDRRIYVGDQGSQRIQVYLADGTFSFGITNGFGGGEMFRQPRGMITDRSGNLYVADYSNNCVFVFTADGAFLRKIGGVTGSGDGQLNGVFDVGVAADGQIYVLERANSRVSVFNSNGGFLRKWGEAGMLDGQFYSPTSIAVSDDDRVYVCQRPFTADGWPNWAWNDYTDHNWPPTAIKEFSKTGLYLRSVRDCSLLIGNFGNWGAFFKAISVRISFGGYPLILRSIYANANIGGADGDESPIVRVASRDLDTVCDVRLEADVAPGIAIGSDFQSPCQAVGPDGTIVVCRQSTRGLYVFKQTLRELLRPNPNAIPMPAVWKTVQRASSPLVDIDYEVTDADDTNVYAAVLVFKNGTQAISNCIRNLTFVEGTATNIGADIAANQPHRLTWNAGADWSTSLADYRVAILAKDSRTNLLDIHYLHLPAERTMPALTISRSPLVTNDFMQVWWWLLASGDTGIGISSNSIMGVGGAYDAQTLCVGGSTTANGRSYIYAKMNIREATAAELQWSKEAATAGSVERWQPARTVAGRPAAVNEYGFDTGNWGTDAWWVVPLN